MQREPDTWTADTSAAYWPTVWRHKIWCVQWHPAILLATLILWSCIAYLTAGHTKSALMAHEVGGFLATMGLLLGGCVSLGQALCLGQFVLPKSWRKVEPSIGLVELPCTIGFVTLLVLMSA